MSDDLQRLRERLAIVGAKAAKLPWARDRAWSPATHVWVDDRLPTIDLHDLSVRLGLEVVDAVEELSGELESGAVRFITGRGRHTAGKSTLREAVSRELQTLARNHGWVARSAGPARFVLIIDRERAPSVATSGLGWFFWLIAALFGVGLWVTWPPLVALPVAAAAWHLWTRVRRR